MAETPAPNLKTVSGRLTKQFGTSTDAKQKELIQGAQFGEAILGDEGLGRVGTDPTMAGIREKLAKRAEGFTGAEETARREKAIGGLAAQGEAQRRALQASLARSGVKGGAAGQQLTAQALGTAQQRAGFERDFLIQQRQAEGQGLQEQLAAESGIQQFDLGQAAKEKNIALQTGLGFAQLGAGERGAKLASDAAVRAAQAQQPGSSGGLIGGVGRAVGSVFCHREDTEVLMDNGSYKKIGDIKLGDIVRGGGKVILKADMENPHDMYEYMGEYVTGSHYVLEGKKWLKVEDSKLSTLREDLNECVICPMETEDGFYTTKAGYISGDFGMEYDELVEVIREQKGKAVSA